MQDNSEVSTVKYASEIKNCIEYINEIQIRNQSEPITLDSVKELGRVAKDRQVIEKRQHELTLLLEITRK